MVDYKPFNGDFTGTVVRNNTILGGLTTKRGNPGDGDGTDSEDAIIK